MALKNDVLYFIALHHKSATKDKIIEICKGFYTEKLIVEAKICLLKGCSVTLNKIDNELITEISKVRRNSTGRDKLGIIIEDIIKVLKSLEGNNEKIEINANDL